MVYVIEYDRESGRTVSLNEFPDEEMGAAQALRFKRELAVSRQEKTPEIVVLSAANKDELRRTHSKYFGDAAIAENIRRLTA